MSEAQDLRVLCPPATSLRWLIPRLEGFRRLHPEIRVRLTTDFYGDQGLSDGVHDVGFSLEHWPGREPTTCCAPLFPVRLTPACSPSLLARAGAPANPDQLYKLGLLHETPMRHDWRHWLASFGLDPAQAQEGEDFPNLDAATRAALMGAGVVMADLELCREEFESGALVMPFPDRICDGPFGGVCLIATREHWHESKVVAFRAWAEGCAGAQPG